MKERKGLHAGRERERKQKVADAAKMDEQKILFFPCSRHRNHLVPIVVAALEVLKVLDVHGVVRDLEDVLVLRVLLELRGVAVLPDLGHQRRRELGV